MPMRARDLPGYRPADPRVRRDYDLDDLPPNALVTLGEFPAYQAYDVADENWVETLIQRLATDPGTFEPIVVLPPDCDTVRRSPDLEIVTGCHRLTAAYALGWPVVPAYVVHVDPDS